MEGANEWIVFSENKGSSEYQYHFHPSHFFFQRFSIHLISAYKCIKCNKSVRSGDCLGPSCQMVIKLGKYNIMHMLKIRLRVHLKRAIHEV